MAVWRRTAATNDRMSERYILTSDDFEALEIEEPFPFGRVRPPFVKTLSVFGSGIIFEGRQRIEYQRVL